MGFTEHFSPLASGSRDIWNQPCCDMIFVQSTNNGESSLPLSSCFCKAIFQVSWRHSSLIVLISTNWAQVHLKETEGRGSISHTLTWLPSHFANEPYVTPAMCLISSLLCLIPISFVPSFTISSSSFSTLILSFSVCAHNCGFRLLRSRYADFFCG